MLIVIALLLATAAKAEPLPKPRPKIGAVCPSGWSASFDYCVETNCKSR